MPNSQAPDELRPYAHRGTPVHFEPLVNQVHEDLPAFRDQFAYGRSDRSVVLQAAQTTLANASRMATLAEMSATIAHEVNQPLAAIVMGAETSLRWLKRDDPDLAKAEQLLRRIVSNARRANDIVQRIRDLATKQDPERVAIDLNEPVEEALLFVRPRLKSRSIKLSAKLGAAMPSVLGDRVQLQQVIINLVVNSIQAVAHAEASTRRINLSTSSDKDDAVGFSIRDSGPGIPDENLERVFESFFTTKDGGMGMGLSICRSIIEAHGGSIAVTNHPRGGAQFRFTLPAMPGAKRHAQRPASG
jgi:two-component system sensor kinase FixL